MFTFLELPDAKNLTKASKKKDSRVKEIWHFLQCSSLKKNFCRRQQNPVKLEAEAKLLKEPRNFVKLEVVRDFTLPSQKPTQNWGKSKLAWKINQCHVAKRILFCNFQSKIFLPHLRHLLGIFTWKIWPTQNQCKSAEKCQKSNEIEAVWASSTSWTSRWPPIWKTTVCRGYLSSGKSTGFSKIYFHELFSGDEIF